MKDNEFGIYEVGETIRGPLGRATYEPDFAPTRPWKIVNVAGVVVNRVATKAQAQERVSGRWSFGRAGRLL